MCGIAGYLVPEGVRAPGPEALDRALAKLAHRGPDGSGVWQSPDRRVALGHRRLAVIDPEGGAQPMEDPETGCVVVTNGEVYNFRDLLREAEEGGRPSRTRSDTEALLAVFARHGAGALPRLRGMFAFAAFDPRSGRLLLARDRMGQKPLLTASLPGGGIAFASEVPALLELLGGRPEPDREALSLFLSFGYFPAPFSAWRGLRRLPAGHLLEVPGGEPRAWWRPPAPEPAPRDRREVAERLRDAIAEAVRIRLVSDVPLGVFLSGGLDSATVVAMMAREGSGPVRTFTVRTPQAEYDEAPLARLVAERYDTDHAEIGIEPPAAEELPELLRGFGEPFGDSSAVATALISRAARRHVTVALTGDGGDEAFGGYDRYRVLRAIARIPAPAARLLAGAPGRFGRAGRLAAMEPWRRYYEFYEAMNGGLRDRLLHPSLRKEHGRASAEFLRRLWEGLPGDDADRMLAVDRLTWLPDDLNPKVDLASMAVGLECRSPLEDHLLVEACARLPAAMHLRGRGKALLREAVGDLLPPEVLAARKRGFAAPVEHWFGGGLGGLLAAKLRSPALRSLDLVDPAVVEELLAGRERRPGGGWPRIRLWILLALAVWAEEEA